MKEIQDPSFEKALKTLRAGDLIGLPTETVYGLAANALQDEAVAKLYALKDRPHFNPLIAPVASLKQAEEYVELNEWACKLTAAFCPGPLTLILPKKENCAISLLATAGLDTLAIRLPAHKVAQKILQNIDFPLVAPRANPSESISPTTAEHVRQAFPNLYVVEGGSCTVGLESTIVDLTRETPVILRPGSITPEDIEKILGAPLTPNKDQEITSPGQMKRHYAPSIPLRLNAKNVDDTEALLSFGDHALKGAAYEINLSPSGDLQEAAANLFKSLKELDTPGHTGIAVTSIPETGIGIAINDRLKRASS